MSSFDGYHTNDKTRCDCFINDKSRLILSENDKFYLGTGMYFWDNKSNAKYWYREKMRKEPNLELSVVTCEISSNDMLDLTDDDIRRWIFVLWDQLKKKTNLNDLKLTGLILDMLYCNSNYLSVFNVIKMIAKYTYHDRTWSDTYVATNMKTIYCIKNCRPILGTPSDCTEEVV